MPVVRLLVAKVVIRTILAKCAQRRWRSDGMCLHASTFVKDVQCNLIESLGTPVFELITCLKLIWRTWRFSISHGAEFRACSFRLIALLGPVIDCLDIRRKPLQICFIHLYQFPELCKNAFNGVKYLAAAFNTL